MPVGDLVGSPAGTRLGRDDYILFVVLAQRSHHFVQPNPRRTAPIPPMTLVSRSNPFDSSRLAAIELRYPLPQRTAKRAFLDNSPMRANSWGKAI